MKNLPLILCCLTPCLATMADEAAASAPIAQELPLINLDQVTAGKDVYPGDVSATMPGEVPADPSNATPPAQPNNNQNNGNRANSKPGTTTNGNSSTNNGSASKPANGSTNNTKPNNGSMNSPNGTNSNSGTINGNPSSQATPSKGMDKKKNTQTSQIAPSAERKADPKIQPKKTN